jgi:DNA-binding NtrC family response regulator
LLLFFFTIFYYLRFLYVARFAIALKVLNLPKTDQDQIQILLVDDDSQLLSSTKKCLNLECNYDIDLASSAESAVEKMTQKEYDAIVCDIQMPITDGFEFLKSLRDNGNNIPFIVFTVTEDKETALKAFRLGANGFVGKYGEPQVVFSTLIKCVNDAINNSQEKKQNESADAI